MSMGLIRSDPDSYVGTLVVTPRGLVAKITYWYIDVGPTMVVHVTYFGPITHPGGVTGWLTRWWSRVCKREFYDQEIDDLIPLIEDPNFGVKSKPKDEKKEEPEKECFSVSGIERFDFVDSP